LRVAGNNKGGVLKVLIICYCYPPDPGPRAYRWSAIAEYWAARGDTVHVISARKQGAPPEEELNGVDVHRAGGAIVENLRLWLESGGKRRAEKAPGGDPLTGPGGLLKTLHDATWKKIYWPDSACLWFFPARAKALKLGREISFDSIISTSTPYTGHLIGKAIKTAHADLPWIVDIGDPFSFGQPPLNNTVIFESRNYRSEAAVLELADGVSVTVESCKKAYADLFPGVAEKITVIPPLFSAAASALPGKSTPHRGRKLVFTGSLYRDIRNPSYLLKLLSGVFAENPDVEAHFYGRVNDCDDLFDAPRRQFPNNLFIHGLVTREAAAAALNQADFLVNISNRTKHQLPSKLVDYMATGKPIINIVSIEEDNSLSFLGAYPETATFMDRPGASVGDDVEKLSGFIANHGAVPQETVTRLLRRFQLPAIEKQYRNLFMAVESS
jgi:glycosyltransferase involved in cell wall biosynthesis